MSQAKPSSELTKKKPIWFGLGAFFLLCFGAAALGSLATAPEIGGWYATLRKPTWNPPNWIFGPVWSLLYFLMAVAAWLVWKGEEKNAAASAPLRLFFLQLALNVAWSWIFFHLHSPGWALLELVALWAAILATTLAFWKRSTTAGVLFVPYFAWVCFASTLNFMIWRLNA